MRTNLLKILMLLIIAMPINIFSINLTEYEAPETKIMNAYIYARFNSNNGNQDQTSFGGNINGYFHYYYYSNQFTWNTQVNLDMYTNRMDTKDSDTLLSLGASIFTNLDYYLGKGDFFIFGDLNLAYFNNDVLENNYRPMIEYRSLYRGVLGAGFGYGRFYDVTSLAVAMRVIDELLEYKIIKSEPTKSGYIKLAQLIDNRPEYISKYGRVEYNKYWYADLEKVLQNENILVEKTLTAFGTLKVQELVEKEAFFERRNGWILRSGSHFLIRDYMGEENDTSLFASLKIGIPVSRQLQFTNKLVYDLVFPKDTNISKIFSHQIVNQLSLSYELSNSIDFINSHTLVLNHLEETVITNSFSSTVRYYLAPGFSFDTTITLSHVNDNIDNNGNDDFELTTFLNLRYKAL